MSTYIYEDGAVHNDHHKEVTVNLLGKTDITSLVRAFMSDDEEIVEEVQETNETANDLNRIAFQPECPVELQTQQAQIILKRLQEAGMLDARMQPLNLSKTEKGVLAFQMAVKLKIKNVWQVFATWWGTTPGSLRSAYNRANEQRKTIVFLEKLKNILN